MRVRLMLFAIMLLTAAIYWPGLRGPFVLDDGNAFGALHAWLSGHASWQEVVPGYSSWLNARPVSMASFMLTGWLGGSAPFSFKLGNLVIHLLCGLLGWQVLRRALARDPRLAPHADLIASLLAALWLLHPLHASTVLYAVQRMAQLSTLFVLASLWSYFSARRLLADGRHRAALLQLFVLCPLLMATALLSKQNGAVAPALCLVLELAYFGRPRPKPVLTFFGLFLVLPALAAGILLAIAPERLLDGYAEWDFTLGQRLLTQARVLVDYLGTLLLPYGPRMGLYTDDFPTSTGLLSPPSTLFALALLTTISITAIALRKRAPSLFAGWFFFLVAHAVESSFLPLEMYYEHRNYLPSIGVFLALTGVFALVPRRSEAGASLPKLALVAVAGLAAVLAFATLGRVLVWRHHDTIVAQALRFHPNSLRARLDLVSLTLRSGRYDDSERLLSRLAQSPIPRHRLLANLNLITTQCLRDGKANPAYLQRVIVDAQPQLTVFEFHSLRSLIDTTGRSRCAGIEDARIARAIAALLDRSPQQPERVRARWMVRFLAAQLYARAGEWRNARRQAEIVWAASADLATGTFLAQMRIRDGDSDGARTLLSLLSTRLKPHDTASHEEMRRIRAALAGQAPPAAD